MSINPTKITSKLTTATEDMNYIAFFSNDNTTENIYTIASLTEVFRCPITPNISGDVATMDYTMQTSQSCPRSTVSSATTTTITLVSASSFAVGDRVEIRSPGNYQKRQVTGKTGNQITLNLALPYTPSNGVEVGVLITMRTIIENGTSSANSGTIFDNKAFEYDKKSGVAITGNAKLYLKGN